jgi:hypothetical protein
MKKVIVTSGWGAGYPEGGGMQWLNLHYMAGLRALGVEPFWLDIAGPAPKLGELVEGFRDRCERFGFGDNWAVIGSGEKFFGMNVRSLVALCADCDLLINLCGALKDDELLRHIKRRAYFDLDPGFTQIWAQQWDMDLSKHNLYFTVGLNVGGADFPIPTRGLDWQTFLPPVALEYWPMQTEAPTKPFTTIGQWRGQEAVWRGEYYGPKREEFLKLIELPRKIAALTPRRLADSASQPLELALLIHQSETDDIGALRGNGFRAYIQQSRAEFSVAKSGYVKSHSGWFSDRTVCYLASGRPALVQDTGFGNQLPTGRGMLTFATLGEALRGLAEIDADYAAHSAAARRLAEDCFAAPRVLQSILERAGVL